MPTLTFRRHDPWWGVDGPAARRKHRYQRFVSFIALVASLVAIGGAGAVWAIHLGFAAILGLQLSIAI